MKSTRWSHEGNYAEDTRDISGCKSEIFLRYAYYNSKRVQYLVQCNSEY